MSYCVNCGVELDATASACPLCNTKVYHPDQKPVEDLPTPFATVKGAVEPVKAREFTVLMSIVLAVTALVCVFLNIFTIPFGHWSYYVVGICAMLWIFLIPLFFPQHSNLYLQLALNGLSIALFLALVSYLHPNGHWYEHIALPIVGLGTALLEVVCLFAIKLKSSMLMKTMICVAAVAVFCMVTELVIDLHLRGSFYLRWSAIVAACALVIDIVLLTIYFLEGLRAEFRKRMHF